MQKEQETKHVFNSLNDAIIVVEQARDQNEDMSVSYDINLDNKLP